MVNNASELTHPFMLSVQKPPPALINQFFIYSEDYDKIRSGEQVTIDIPHKVWTLVVGYDKDDAKKYTVNVNGIEMSELPRVELIAAHYPQYCKSNEEKMYSENIR